MSYAVDCSGIDRILRVLGNGLSLGFVGRWTQKSPDGPWKPLESPWGTLDLLGSILSAFARMSSPKQFLYSDWFWWRVVWMLFGLFLIAKSVFRSPSQKEVAHQNSLS